MKDDVITKKIEGSSAWSLVVLHSSILVVCGVHADTSQDEVKD